MVKIQNPIIGGRMNKKAIIFSRRVSLLAFCLVMAHPKLARISSSAAWKVEA